MTDRGLFFTGLFLLVLTGQKPGLPRFTRELQLEPKAETSANVSAGDLNGDGKLDLVLAKGRHWGLVDRVLLGDGRGKFPTAFDLGTASDRSYSGRLSDLDGDGDLDVVISNDAPDPKLVYLNDGTGHFQRGSAYGKPEWGTRNATVADLNGDGRPDIIVANRFEGNGADYICLNRGEGRFDADCSAFAHEPATTITAADFDHDGRADLAVPNRDGGQSYVYLRSSAVELTFRRVPFGPPDAAFRVSEAADFDGDGRMDLAAIDERRGLFVFLGQPGDSLSGGLRVTDAKVMPYALAVGDLDKDGKIDLVLGNVEAPSVVFFNGGNGRAWTPVRFGDNKGTVYGFAIADLDGDGWPDIAAARSEAPNMLYFATPPRP